MNGTLSQLVALCSAANGVIDGCLAPSTFYPSHADFKFCNSVRFVDLKTGISRKPREIERYGDPNQWLHSVKDTNAIRAWLTFSGSQNPDAPDHQLSAFVGGGGNWKLLVATERFAESWMSRWKVTAQNAKDNRIWGVTYGCIEKSARSISVPQPDLNAAANRLRSALSDAQQFATKHELPAWANWFQRAFDCFDSTKPLAFPEYVQFVCLDSYPEAAQRLLAAAYNGWVFGGMGSWNDLGFDPKSENDRYDEISAELYAAINDAIQQSTWSFAKQKAA
jgi:hypothetical protein